MSNYIERSIESELTILSNEFPVIMITGPRQVGKTTLLKHLQEEKQMNYISLDDLKIRKIAIEDPELLLDTYPAPVIIDEFQYAPNLLSYIKLKVDKDRYESLKNNVTPNGKYYLTGSQVFKTLNFITESLAGRIGIINLYGLSDRELNKISSTSKIFIPEIKSLSQKEKLPKQNINDLYERIFRGSFPNLWQKNSPSLEFFYESYIRTYIERDIRDLNNIKDELKFYSFIVSVAVRTGSELNYS